MRKCELEFFLVSGILCVESKGKVVLLVLVCVKSYIDVEILWCGLRGVRTGIYANALHSEICKCLASAYNCGIADNHIGINLIELDLGCLSKLFLFLLDAEIKNYSLSFPGLECRRCR